MKKFIFAPLLIFVIGLSAAAQNPSPTPPAESDDVVKISTALIQVDVTVTDSKGNPVKDLKPEDFEVYENGEKQKITNFKYVSSVRERAETVKSAAGDKLAVPVPYAELKAEQVRRTIALVVDDLSLSFQSTAYVRRALKKYVDEQMRDGDLVAIIRTGAGIGALQQFTSDKRLLYAAIEKVKWNPLGNGRLGAFAPIRDNEKIQNEQETEEQRQAKENSEKSFNDFQSSYFATGTLGALRFIVNGMGELPGRKSVILFSDGFKLLQKDENGFTEGGSVLEFLRRLVDAANRASVVFYTIDARGLVTTGISAEDSVNGSAERLQQVLSERGNELFDTQAGLSYLAAQTGGMSVLNNNDLSGGVRRVLDDQSYYLLGYEPDSDTFDAKTSRFNKLEIKVKNKDFKLRYRSGFFNVADRNTAKTAINQTPVQQLQNALTSPFAVNDISLRLNALFGNDAVNGSFMRPLLHINAQDLKFTDDPDGTKKTTFEILAVTFGDNGAVIEQLAKSYTLPVNEEVYKKIMKDGFVYFFTLPIKKPGAYQFRVAIRDAQTGKVGSASQFVEIPNLKKERLTISGIILENMTQEQWKAFASETPGMTGAQSNKPLPKPDAMTDTSMRRFKRGTVLRYGFEVYNARLDASKKLNLTSKIRVYRDGQLLLDGKQIPIDVSGQIDMERIKSAGAINLIGTMQPGDYILQIIITDNAAKEKSKITSQFVQFEVIE
jgi:VWFA-related protein